MRRIQLLGGVLLLVLAGCGINRSDLTRDTRVLLNKYNVRPQTLKVTMSDRSRTGIAECSVTANEVAAIVAGLGLLEVEGNTDDLDVRSWIKEGKTQFNHPLLDQKEGIQVFRSTRRPKTLRLSNGSSFEYMLLFWNKAKGMVLIQLSYAYG